MKLLIIDDNPQMRRLLRRVLTGLFTEVCECADGTEAVAAYSHQQPDWVLMDIEMPEVDGLTATRRIRAEFPAAQIVMVTQYDDRELRAAASAAGVSGYVLKDDLLSLRSLLQAELR